MKHILFHLFSLFFFSSLFAQTNQWTWVKGDNFIPQLAIYGTKGVAAAENKPGGRQAAVSWIDAAGDLWLFGGSGHIDNGLGRLNDIWKYAPATGQWTWVGGDNTFNQKGVYGTKGITNASNKPGGRAGAVRWKDAAGDFWLFGGYGYAGSTHGALNDLWKYTPATGQWTWMSGDSVVNQTNIFGTLGEPADANKPGARSSAVSWTDTSGNFWLFGGIIDAAGVTPGYLADLWKYTPSTGQWTWMSGDSTFNRGGVYGSKGTAAPANKPGSRCDAVSWTDKSGNLWLFGGYGNVNQQRGDLNDLWKYTPLTGQWTWVRGDTNANQLGVYGTKGTAAPANQPGSRKYAVGWTDTSGNFWLFGGEGYYSQGPGSMTDLWKYAPSTGNWTWVAGDNSFNPYGTYGTRDVAAATNRPGGHFDAVSWTDASDNLWMFGGNGLSTSYVGSMNDLWKYTPSTGEWTWRSGDNDFSSLGIYGTKGIASPANKPGAREAAVSWTDVSGDLWLFGGHGSAASMLGYMNDLWKFSPSTGQWVWMSGDDVSYRPGIYGSKGVAAPDNKPGARHYATSWSDAAGNLWLFGGYGNTLSVNQIGYLNDLWKYTPSTGRWTWMNGNDLLNHPGVYGTKGIAAPLNNPGARQGAVSWKDASGNLWLFGGAGYTTAGQRTLNDLWKYAPSSGLWTWMGGDNTSGQAGVYGAKGIASATNKPGARQFAVSWEDNAGNLWLFGGMGVAASTSGTLNDLWKYTPSTGQWTWMSGDNTVSAYGVYSTKGIAAVTNKPGAMQTALGWVDNAGDLYLSGGDVYNISSPAYTNDLWKYTPSTGLWTWISGDSISQVLGVYGTQGVAAASNKPGHRQRAVAWTDLTGNFWLFGGIGYAANGFGDLNDLWKYTPSSSTLPVQFASFTARKQTQTVLLNWATAQEQNSRYFVVERSANGIRYNSIGEVTATGTTSRAASYSFVDATPLKDTNFYRLKQVDHDGRFMYSSVVKVVMDQEATRLVVMQHPVQTTLRLSIQLTAAQKLIIQVSDASGRLLLREEQMGKEGSSVYAFPVERLARGTYSISVQTGTSTYTRTFIKQ